MRYAHTVEQVRDAERALAAYVTEGSLMQRAAAGLASACAGVLGDVYGSRVGVLTGSGANGGDALFAAARLARRGARVEALRLGSAVHEAALTAFVRSGGRVVAELSRADMVLDGIVGIGGRPGLHDEAAAAVDRARRGGPFVVAVDVPSGIDVDGGRLAGDHVDADLTVTFGTPKIGLLVRPASRAAGVVTVVDIGLAPYLGEPALAVLQDADVRRLLPVPGVAAHKYTRGVVGIAAGSAEYPGAGLLTVSAAVAAGWAGMVRYVGGASDLIRANRPEVVIGDGRVQARVVGPGGGADAGGQLRTALNDSVPVVVDADGLGHLPEGVPATTVVTPHAGELARLLGTNRGSVDAAPLAALRTAVERLGCVVLLKGSRTLVGAPGRPVSVNPTGVPWLATAGAGDVLSGVVGSLLASGLSSYDAARVGAYLHGRAGAIASSGGTHPISAEQVIGALPAAAASCRREIG